MYYSMYRSYVSISEDRAVRVTYERERLLDDKGNLSLDTSAGSQTMKEGIKDNLVDLRTIVKYKKWRNENTARDYLTVSLEDIRRHQESRLRSFKSRSIKHFNCYWNNL